ncbi:MAG: hypothetical protein WD359_02120 [Dehalococcoidia bacterium]
MRTEWLILADHADIVGNKLYLNGGGWDVLSVLNAFPSQRMVGIAAAFRVEWNETNQRHNVEIEVLSADGASLAKVGGQFEVGRPPGLPPGQAQRAQLALNVGLNVPAPGVYEIVSRIEGQEDSRTAFNVVSGPALPQFNQPPQQS